MNLSLNDIRRSAISNAMYYAENPQEFSENTQIDLDMSVLSPEEYFFNRLIERADTIVGKDQLGINTTIFLF